MIIITGQSNLTKRRIAATHGQYSMYFRMGRHSPLKSLLPMGIWTTI